MPRYVALLRGVSPQNAKMSELKAAFESAGFSNVKTVISSGNVVFDSEKTDQGELEAIAEEAMARHLGRTFYAIVRSISELETLLASDPYAEHGIPRDAKRVVSFFRQPPCPKTARVSRRSAGRCAGVARSSRKAAPPFGPSAPPITSPDRSMPSQEAFSNW